MDKLLIIFTTLLIVFNTACSSGQNKRQNSESAVKEQPDHNYGDVIENEIVGKWKNGTVDVDLSTYNNTDTSFHISVNESNWKIVMNINPIITSIREDGSFVTEYRDTLNNVFHTNRGIWYIDGDSLFLEDEKGKLFPYKILLKGNEMEMETMVDYDEDGKKDDFYIGSYKRIK